MTVNLPPLYSLHTTMQQMGIGGHISLQKGSVAMLHLATLSSNQCTCVQPIDFHRYLVHTVLPPDGCTGAGKSYTMMGAEPNGMNDARSGICPRAVRDVFQEASRYRQDNTSVAVHVRGAVADTHKWMMLMKGLTSATAQDPFLRRYP